MAQDILNGTYEINGEKKTGTELFAQGIVELMQNPYAKNWGKAVEVLMQLTGSNLTPEEIKKQKAEIALLKAKQQQLTAERNLIPTNGVLESLLEMEREDIK